MRLTWRDGATTLLAAAVVGIYATHSAGWAIPFVENARWATLVVGGVGLSMCIVGGSAATIAAKGTFFAVAGIFGGAAMLLMLVGLVTGWSLALGLLTADIVLLWIVSTTRHAAMSRPHVTGVPLGRQA